MERSHPELQLCKLCGEIDSQMHILLECNDTEFADLRQHAHETLLHVADELRRNALCEYQKRVIQFFIDHAFDASYEDIDRLWLGTWNAHVLREALFYKAMDLNVTDNMSYETAMQIQQVIVALTKPLVTATKKIMHQTHVKINFMKQEQLKPKSIFKRKSYVQTVAQSSLPCQRKKKSGMIWYKKNRLYRINQLRHGPKGSVKAGEVQHEQARQWISLHGDEDCSGYFAAPFGPTEPLDYDKD